MRDGEDVVGMGAGHEYVGGTHGTNIVSNAADMLRVNAVCG